MMWTRFLVVVLLGPVWSIALQAENVNSEKAEEQEKKVSLAQLARKEKERRANTKKVPVITNADLRSLKGLISVAEPPPAPPGEQTKEGQTEEEVESSEPDLGEWGAKFNEARLNIKNSVSRSSVLQLKMNDLRNQFFSEDDGATQSRIQEQLQATLQELETNKQEIQTARQALQQLEREASQAGIPPESVRQMVGELPKEESIVNSPGN